MIRILYIFLTISACINASAQNANLFTQELTLGDSNIGMVQQLTDKSDSIQFLNLHENEQTSLEALRKFSKSHLLNYFYLKHSGDRRIQFSLNGEQFSVDPNRIFTDVGRKKTLQDGQNYSVQAERSLKKFAESIIQKIAGKDVVVAMHNNTENNYSIKSYLPGGSEFKNTKHVHVNDIMDPDDFIYTTDEKIYQAMVTRDVNVILQDNSNMVDDGSLSVYCGMKGIRYVNIETQHGHINEQLELMKVILSILRD